MTAAISVLTILIACLAVMILLLIAETLQLRDQIAAMHDTLERSPHVHAE